MVIRQLAVLPGWLGCLVLNLPCLRFDTRGLTRGLRLVSQDALMSRATQRRASLPAPGGKSRVCHNSATYRA